MTFPLTRATLTAACLQLASFLAGGCGKECAAIFIPSEARLTLHLPPEGDVAMPETVRVCQEPKCRTGILPPLADQGTLASFTFEDSVATGFVSVAPGGVRLLSIAWPIEKDDAFIPNDPENQYHVDVVDSTGATTGKLSAVIHYRHITDSECGVDAWMGAASD